MNVKKVAAIVVGVGVLSFAGTCSSEQAKKGGETVKQEQTAVQTGFNRLSNSQPIPVFDWSQERQTVIDAQTIRATGAKGTTSGYLEGVGLVWWCPSVGGPVPSTYQLSAGTQWADIAGDHTADPKQVEQGEPTGVYVGESTATWTVCLDDNGKKFLQYWEGYVLSTIGIVNGLPGDKRVRVNESTYEFKDGPR